MLIRYIQYISFSWFAQKCPDSFNLELLNICTVRSYSQDFCFGAGTQTLIIKHFGAKKSPLAHAKRIFYFFNRCDLSRRGKGWVRNPVKYMWPFYIFVFYFSIFVFILFLFSPNNTYWCWSWNQGNARRNFWTNSSNRACEKCRRSHKFHKWSWEAPGSLCIFS